MLEKWRETSSVFFVTLIAVTFLFGGVAFAQDTGDTPPAAASGALLRDGVFGCLGSKYANPGTLAAVGGVYVPVNDAAVTINTGYLVYKECMLDGVVAKISEAARTELTAGMIRTLNTQRDGKAQFRQNFSELTEGKTSIIVSTLQDQSFMSVMSDAYRSQVQQTVARRFLEGTQKPNTSFASTFPGSPDQLRAFYETREGFSFEGLIAMSNPCNNPLGALNCFEGYLDRALASYDENQRQEWVEGRGFYSVVDDPSNSLGRKVLTPSSLVGEGAAQIISAGFRCLEGADELSEVCAPLFSGLASQLIGDRRGLQGITQPVSGLPSYVSRMVSEASAAVRQEAVNTAMAVLSVARQTEALYKQAKEGSAAVVTNAINRLRSAERTCWNLVVNNICSAAPDSRKECSTKQVCSGDPEECTTPIKLRVATSTAFSQAVIDARIAPIATQVAADLRMSEQGLAQLDQLIASVTDSASATSQRQAIERLDTLVANNLLHNGNDVTAARTQTESITASFTELVEATLTAWGDSPDVNVGWCNVNNPSVIDYWTNEWKI